MLKLFVPAIFPPYPNNPILHCERQPIFLCQQNEKAMKNLYCLTIAFFVFSLVLRAQDATGGELSPIHSRLLMFSYDDGMIDYHGLGENNTKDQVLSRPLNAANAGNVAYYSLSSADDPNYAAPQRPLSVGRKSKGNCFSGNFDAAYPVVMSHAMYLELPHPLAEGASYTLVLDHEALNVVRDTLHFTFVANELRSEALHVNQIGYVADPAIPKYGYLYHWAGDKGGIDFSAFAGQAFRLVEVQTGATAFTGTVAFRGSGSLQENGRSNEAQNYTRTAVWECDFTSFATPGAYRLAIDGIGCSFPFEIKSDVYRELFYHTARALYHQRSGIAKNNGSTEYAFPRDHHPDDGFEVIMSNIRDLGSGPENRTEWAANTTGDTLRNYYYAIEWFDRQVGEVLSFLEQAGELDNTLIVITSDNGMPFPRAKSNLYDYGARLPLAIAWNQHFKGGRRVSDFVSLPDLAPTFLECAGLPIPTDMSKKSLLPILSAQGEGRIDPARDHIIMGKELHAWCHPDGEINPLRAIRTDEYLYTQNLKPEMWPAGHPDPQYAWDLHPYGDVDQGPSKTAVLQGKDSEVGRFFFDLAFGKRPAEELYYLPEDPYQLHNLAFKPGYQEIKRALQEQLHLYLENTGDPRTLGRPAVFDQAPYFWSHGLATAGLPLQEWEKLSPEAQAAKVDSLMRRLNGE